MCFIIITFRKRPLSVVAGQLIGFTIIRFLISRQLIENRLALIVTRSANYSPPPPCSPSGNTRSTHTLPYRCYLIYWNQSGVFEADIELNQWATLIRNHQIINFIPKLHQD